MASDIFRGCLHDGIRRGGGVSLLTSKSIHTTGLATNMCYINTNSLSRLWDTNVSRMSDIHFGILAANARQHCDPSSESKQAPLQIIGDKYRASHLPCHHAD